MVKETFEAAGAGEDPNEGFTDEALAASAVMARFAGKKITIDELHVKTLELLSMAGSFASQSLWTKYKTPYLPEDEYKALLRKTIHEYGERKFELADLQRFEEDLLLQLN